MLVFFNGDDICVLSDDTNSDSERSDVFLYAFCCHYTISQADALILFHRLKGSDISYNF